MWGEMEALVKYLIKYLKISEEDAIVAAICAMAGFSADALFFPAGMPPLTVTVLSGAAGLLSSRWLKNRKFFLDRLVKKIDRLVADSVISQERGEEYKDKLVEKWLESARGIKKTPKAKIKSAGKKETRQ